MGKLFMAAIENRMSSLNKVAVISNLKELEERTESEPTPQ